MANNTVYPYGTDGQLPASIGIVNDLVTGGADKALSAEAGRQLNTRLYGSGGRIIYTKDDATVYKVKSGQEVATNYNRLRVVLPIEAGWYAKASCSAGKGVAASIYATTGECIVAATDFLQTFSYSYVPSIEGVAQFTGYLCVSLAKSNDNNFTGEEAATYLAALTIEVGEPNAGGDIEDIQEQIAEIAEEVAGIGAEEKDEEPLFLGTLLQKSMTASGLSDTNKEYRVSTASCMVIPREKATLQFYLPDKYAVGIRNGNEANNLSYNDYWYFNEGTFTFRADVHYFRLCFAYVISLGVNDAVFKEITVEEIEQLISNGKIRITVKGVEAGIVARNADTEKYVKAMMRKFVAGISNNGSLTKLPVFAHTSDLHGDAKRFLNYMDYCDFLGVDAALVTGDLVAISPTDSMQYALDIADTHATPVLYCLGNHDARSLTTEQAQNAAGIGYLIEKNESSAPVGVTYPTYYYQDFTAKQIRVISVNLYELSHTSDNCNFTQAQCEWLIATLASTPANYGVLILFHSPEAQPEKDDDHDDFYQNLLTWTGWQANLTGNVFRQIVDAFIGKSSATITYKVGNTTITTSADFTSVESGVEFIAYVNGHLHADLVGYISGATQMQLNLNVCCGVAIYGSTYEGLANLSDLPRGCKGATQDSFNIYVIDRTAKTVRIARVGSNISGYDKEERKYMEIPYAE